MGSGLVLLAIVGAWLAVLVPMALRRHDTQLRSADRFHDAMRVLSRRQESTRGAARVDAEVEEPPTGRLASTRARLADRAAARTPLTPAARRRRLLLSLLLLAVGTLVGAALGPLWLLAPHLLADLLLGAFVVHLRRTAAARVERERRAAAQRRRRPRPEPVVPATPLPEPVLQVPAHVAGIPNQMPLRPLPLAASAARYDELPAARGAQGEAWSPVPVPTPTYLTAPTAPRRVVDLTTPGAYADGLADAERELGIVDQGPELDEILERRRAVNDW